MKYEINLNDALDARFFLMLAATGVGSTGLNKANFIEVVRKPDNTTKALTGETYTEQEQGHYGLAVFADFFDLEGEWEIHIDPNDGGVTFSGVIYVYVSCGKMKIMEM